MITYTHTHTCMYRYKVPYIPYNRYNNFINIIIFVFVIQYLIKILNWIFLSNTSFFSILKIGPFVLPPFCHSSSFNFPLLCALPNERNIDIYIETYTTSYRSSPLLYITNFKIRTRITRHIYTYI